MVMVLLAIGSAFGLCMLLWMVYGWFLLPAEGDIIVQVVASGDGLSVLRALRGLCWLCSSGLLHAQIVVVDDGLTKEGRAMVLRMMRSRGGIHLIS